jgi:hypothetical protein
LCDDNMAAAGGFLTAGRSGSKLQLMAAELSTRRPTPTGMALIRRLLEQDPARRDDVAAVG